VPSEFMFRDARVKSRTFFTTGQSGYITFVYPTSTF
jgi:hypothetical protein